MLNLHRDKNSHGGPSAVVTEIQEEDNKSSQQRLRYLAESHMYVCIVIYTARVWSTA